MSKRNHLKEGSKRLSWLLRHGAREAGLTMDDQGWASVADVLRIARVARGELEEIVATNEKRRFELDGERIRAVQGHSPGGTAVSAGALEASWERVTDEADVFHGTSVEAARAILASEGIRPGTRSHVHLAAAVDATVGKRAGVDVLLAVRPKLLAEAGIALYRAPNGVLLARFVPRAAIVGVTAATRHGRAAEAELRAAIAQAASEGKRSGG